MIELDRSIYDNLKLLFSADRNSYSLFLDLQTHCALDGDILYLSPNREIRHDYFVQFCKHYKNLNSKIDMSNYLIREKGYIVRFKTIEEIRFELGDYKFKKIYFTI